MKSIYFFRPGKIYVDDSSLLSRCQRLHHHVRSDKSDHFPKCEPMERGPGLQSMAARWLKDSLPTVGKQSNWFLWYHSSSGAYVAYSLRYRESWDNSVLIRVNEQIGLLSSPILSSYSTSLRQNRSACVFEVLQNESFFVYLCLNEAYLSHIV